MFRVEDHQWSIYDNFDLDKALDHIEKSKPNLKVLDVWFSDYGYIHDKIKIQNAKDASKQMVEDATLAHKAIKEEYVKKVQEEKNKLAMKNYTIDAKYLKEQFEADDSQERALREKCGV
jgi:hypothetical protein